MFMLGPAVLELDMGVLLWSIPGILV